ncbi:Fic family protein [Carnobacterium maltaromaticum]|uniref:Fic family protein n=1 Tax=Carnobacterium maltaromaticum TaxID=2751 RepID=UPI0012FB9D14|nr:Fic family protein [Carnobacterium maltaromaticum]
MKECLKSKGYDLYEDGCCAVKLAEQVLDRKYKKNIELSDLPIDPFYLLKDSGVIYSLLDFSKYEGFYLLPQELSDPEEKAMVGINKNRPITRQRFTAAHELCHHIKDEASFYCDPSDSSDLIEKYADHFATELLMPQNLLDQAIEKYEIVKDISEINYLNQILKISNLFGVSFQATLYRVNKKFKKINYQDIMKVIRAFKPDSKKGELGLNNEYILYSQLISSYVFDNWKPSIKTENDFKRMLISNDHRMENGTLTVDEISEIIAEIRLVGIESVKDNRKRAGIQLCDADFEVLGQWEMYTKVFEMYGKTSLAEMLILHQKFYSFVPYREVGGTFRNSTARITGKNVSTCEPREISMKINECLSEFDKYRIDNSLKNNFEILNYLVKLHHDITVIHPFIDGNGRTSRALLNKQLLFFGIPPFFIKADKKNLYNEFLETCDNKQEYESLFIFFVRNIIEVYSVTLGN